MSSDLPTFRPGQSPSSLSARQLSNAMREIRAFQNLRVGPGLTYSRTADGAAIGLSSQSSGAGREMRWCAVLQPDSDQDLHVWVREVVRNVEESPVDGKYLYEWVGDPFRAFPVFGKSAQDYVGLALQEPALRPPPGLTFLPVQRFDKDYYVWFPAGSGGSKLCAVRVPDGMTKADMRLDEGSLLDISMVFYSSEQEKWMLSQKIVNAVTLPNQPAKNYSEWAIPAPPPVPPPGEPPPPIPLEKWMQVCDASNQDGQPLPCVSRIFRIPMAYLEDTPIIGDGQLATVP